MNKLAGFLSVLAMVAGAPLARADFAINVNGVPCNAAPNPNPLIQASPNGSLECASVAVATGVTITDLAVTGLQASSFSQQLGTTLLVQNTTASAVTITIDIGDSNFSAPVTPPNVSDSSGSTLNVATGTNSITLTSCVNQLNGVLGCGSAAPGMAPANPMLTQSGAGTLSNETTGTITSLHSMFSLTQHIVLSAGANSNFNITTSQVLVSGVIPEPTSVLLLGTVLLGVTGLLRKKVAGR
jgi:hypothetical protein